ncbi:MAG: flagellar protein FlgN [Firmicutes bacterium]|nr:flagellar protein FlgN [Bacillota bacterium]
MQETVAQLTEIMRQQHQLYRKLAGLARAKQQHIIEGNLQELEKANQLEEQLVIQGLRLEDGRRDCQTRLAELFGLSADELTVTSLLEKLPPEQAKPLFNLRDDLMRTVTELQETNRENASLLRQAMDWVEYTLRLLTEPQGDGVYTAEAAADKPSCQEARILDVKV